ncbi:unnamed protein product, partial [Polarella glacialis]
DQFAAKMCQTRPKLFKTKLCRYFQEQRCTRGEACEYAHDMVEVNDTPNLRKTKLCPAFMRGRCNAAADCKFAHGTQELRATMDFFKTSLCSDWSATRTCVRGRLCRYAHGLPELRQPGPLPEVPTSPVASHKPSHRSGIASGVSGRHGGYHTEPNLPSYSDISLQEKLLKENTYLLCQQLAHLTEREMQRQKQDGAFTFPDLLWQQDLLQHLPEMPSMDKEKEPHHITGSSLEAQILNRLEQLNRGSWSGTPWNASTDGEVAMSEGAASDSKSDPSDASVSAWAATQPRISMFPAGQPAVIAL